MDEYIERKDVIDQFDNGEADVMEMYPDGSVDFGFSVSNIRDMINAIPAADVAPIRPELRKAVELLHRNYEKALNSSYVRNPIAWALYHTWRETDEKQMEVLSDD